jgi:hypothetical protein
MQALDDGLLAVLATITFIICGKAHHRYCYGSKAPNALLAKCRMLLT